MRNEVAQFLQAIDAALIPFARGGERLDLYILGRAALILRYGLVLGTKDVDVVTRGETDDLHVKLYELFGEGAAAARPWGLYVQGVAEDFPPLPGRYRKAADDVPGNWQVLRPKLLDPHDLAISKLRRFHSGDREDLRILCDSGDLGFLELNKALESAYPYGMDEDENPDCAKVKRNLVRVIDYLKGRSRSL